MSNQHDVKVFREDGGRVLGFTHYPQARFPVVVDLQRDRRGKPEFYRMDEQEARELLAWLLARLAVPVEQGEQ